jgi:hypothetical protein
MGSVRRWVAYLLVWTVGTAATVGACWLGLRSVLDAAAPQRAAPFSAAELARVAPSPTVTGGADPQAVPVAETQAAPTSAAPTTTTPPRTTAAPTTAPPSPTAEPWVAVRSGRGGTAYTRTFHLQAGDVSFYVDPYDVHVTDSRPRPGYTLVSTRYDSRSLLVSLLSNQRASRVYVSWRGGPYAEVTETVA